MKSMTLMAMVAGVLAAGAVFGQTFDPKRGLRESEMVVVNGKTNVIAEANFRALQGMTVQERAVLWPYVDAQLIVDEGHFGGGVETRRAQFVLAMMSKPANAPLNIMSVIRILVSCEKASPDYVAQYKECVKQYAMSRARLQLFDDGKSLVSKDGKNPLAVLMDPVIAALNGPACQGLIEALVAIGVSDLTDGGILPAFKPPDSKTITEWTDTAKRVVVATGNNQYNGQLLILLGVDNYNAFVKQFNEGQ